MAGLAKGRLHPPFPWPTARGALQTAGGHPGRACSRSYVGPPRSGSSKSTVFQSSLPRTPAQLLAPSTLTHLGTSPPRGPGTDTQPGIRAGLSAEPPVWHHRKGVEDGADSQGDVGWQARSWFGLEVGKGPRLQPHVLPPKLLSLLALTLLFRPVKAPPRLCLSPFTH